MKTISPEVKQVLDRIQASIPEYLTKKVVVRKPVSPEIKWLLEQGVKDEEFSQETREKWQLVLDSGFLDQEIDQEDPDIAEEINAYIELELAKAVFKKEIPKMKGKKVNFESAFRKYNKIKQKNDKKFGRS